jgi:hypothetical protein
VQLGDDDRFSFDRRRGEVTRFSPDRGHPRPKRTYSIDCERCCHPMPYSRALVKNIERIRLIGVSGCKNGDAVINGSQMIMQAWILAFSRTVLYVVDSRKVRRCNAPIRSTAGLPWTEGIPSKKDCTAPPTKPPIRRKAESSRGRSEEAGLVLNVTAVRVDGGSNSSATLLRVMAAVNPRLGTSSR